MVQSPCEDMVLNIISKYSDFGGICAPEIAMIIYVKQPTFNVYEAVMALITKERIQMSSTKKLTLRDTTFRDLLTENTKLKEELAAAKDTLWTSRSSELFRQTEQSQATLDHIKAALLDKNLTDGGKIAAALTYFGELAEVTPRDVEWARAALQR